MDDLHPFWKQDQLALSIQLAVLLVVIPVAIWVLVRLLARREKRGFSLTNGLRSETAYQHNTMYGYGLLTEVKKNTLTSGDIAAVTQIYY